MIQSAAPVPVESAFDYLEAALGKLYDDPTSREQMLSRLQSMLTNWKALAAPNESELADKMRAATHDEIVTLFDEEFALEQ